MSSIISSIKFYIKSTIFGALISGCAIYGVFASILLRLIGKKEYAQYTVARAFYFTFSTILGVKITIKNEHFLHDVPGIVISNHQSALDILMLGKVFQPGYTVTAKKALQYFPFLGWFMLASGTFFLDRARGEKARKVLDNALKTLKAEKRALFMFPEGTRSATKELEMLPFKKGAFHLAQQAGIPIIPVVVSNTSTIFNAKDRVFNSGEIFIEVLEPISTNALETSSDVSAFSLKVRQEMIEALQHVGYSRTLGTSAEQSSVSDNTDEDITDIDTDTDPEQNELSEETPLMAK
ncbi:uncharacterized protein AC631_03971 [Debaryomyces fabryi]|uniref:1-acyl-sn-glycerol-3-phosphate acyltransferase n=1 Tax=Debaryomyces fabryi TaxID=58627 RepID=A0A0V1PVF4_9ASCO|nr:uncharacterized protein AC631_03971 [Debaryomyces fabryi]KSA00265.1 hypothetical protein AC631_03971 [Debaryomyces fabryi]CUM50589.1 unnamed protein product [Debaryomyces fabryi]